MMETLSDEFTTGPSITADPNWRIGVVSGTFGGGHDLHGGGLIGEEDDDAGLRLCPQLFDDTVVVGRSELVADADLGREAHAVPLRHSRQTFVTFQSVLRVGVDQ